MKKILILCAVIGLCACCSTKKTAMQQTDHSKTVSELLEMIVRYEKRVEIYRDSIAKVKALMEKSSNVADSISHLETSYSKSDAAIKGGKLHHSIENKDSIPIPVKHIYIKEEIRDTIYKERIDTVYKEKEKIKEMVIEKKRFAEDFFYYCGWLCWGLVLALVIKRFKQ